MKRMAKRRTERLKKGDRKERLVQESKWESGQFVSTPFTC
jgi:hypothetical protein